MVQDYFVMCGVSGIRQRSERQQDLQKLLGSFVDIGILPQINNHNNQIIYGRRGTGKTHILKVLESQLIGGQFNVVAYIDGRTLGSTAQFTDTSIPTKQRCLCLFRDIFVEIHNGLLEHIIYKPTNRAKEALRALDHLSWVMTKPISKYSEESVTSRTVDKVLDDTSVGLSLGYKDGVNLNVKDEQHISLEEERATSFQVTHEDKVVFPAMHSLLQDILKKTQSTLYVLFDEWSSIPFELQPYLAEFLKRGFFSNPQVVIKIASLEYRSNFGEVQPSGQILGLEIGSDISTALDMDDYYVYDRNPDIVINAFADMLFKHLKIELPEDYLESAYGVSSGQKLVGNLFSNRQAFTDLVRSSEGVARDLINMFTQAYFTTQRKGLESIDIRTVIETARQWFYQDKAKNLDSELFHALQRIVKEVIGRRKARCFLLAQQLEKHPVIRRLFDLRLLHLVRRGAIDERNPAVRYNIYALDYGTYVDLFNTKHQPDMGFKKISEEVPENFFVPFDDKRAIKKIVLTREILDKGTEET